MTDQDSDNTTPPSHEDAPGNDVNEETADSPAITEQTPEPDTEAEQYPVAVISDIHANLEALQTVIADIHSRNISRIIFLGDLVGYGPDPRACIDTVMEHCEWGLMGNHDFASLYEPTNFNSRAETASYWTRFELESEPDPQLRAKRWRFLGQLHIKRKLTEDILCVHGSPRRPINEYIFAEDAAASPTKMKSLFDRIQKYCLVGHTHVQGVFTEEPAFIYPQEIENRYPFYGSGKCIINVGSVGQPRDRDPRAGYVILHKQGIEFVRIEYDFEATIEKIAPISDLNNFFGQRLREGR